ncbi:hypothetical protein [Paenibacillus pinisoli]|nr:hypothetical protein [Paenibacillus pinisoli]
MGRHKQRSSAGRNVSFAIRSRQAENDVAGTAAQHRNQKGHTPNSPSTG